jgi:pimeloyl-ACP methyl ester carboxylesterase
VAHALVESGRRVVNLDLRGHGGSEWPEDGRYDLESHIEDLRAVLAQMASRPVVVAAALGGWIATAALSTDAANLAAGLALVDMPARSDADLLVVTDRTEALLGLLLDFLERKQPRAANEFRGGSDARTLRDAMGCFATGS